MKQPITKAKLTTSLQAAEKRIAELERALDTAKGDTHIEAIQSSPKDNMVDDLHRLYEIIDHGIVQIDANGIIIQANPAAEYILGLSLEEMKGHKPADLRWHAIQENGSDFSEEQLPVARVLQTGKAVNGVLMGFHHPLKNEYIWALVNATPEFCNGETKPYRVYATFTDVTTQILGEDKARRVQQRYQDLFDDAPSMYVITRVQDGALIIVDCNNMFLSMLGYSRAEVLGQPLADFYSPQSRKTALEGGFTRALAGNFKAEERELISHAGEVVNTIMHIALETDASGQVIGTRAMYVDITERKKAEEALQVGNLRSSEILNSISEVFWVFDEQLQKIIYLSPGYEKIWGQSVESVYQDNQKYIESIHPDDRWIMLDALERQARGGKNQIEYRVIQPDGRVRWIYDRSSPVMGENGQIVRVIGVASDITERKRVEEKLRESYEELQALHKIDRAINGSTDLRLSLQVILDHIVKSLKVAAADILIFEPHLQLLKFYSGQGFRETEIEKTSFRLGEGLAGRSALERRMVSELDLNASKEFKRASMLAGETFISYFAMPLITKGKLKGILEVFTRSPFNPDSEWLKFFELLAGQAGNAIDNYQLFEGLKLFNTELNDSYETTIEGWSRALDLRDEETEGHTQRVTEMTILLAKAMGIRANSLLHMRRGALLHDIGKMGVPDSILLKPGKLNDEEWEKMRQHPTFAYELLLPIAYLRPSLDIPYCHHEKWDGSGYPRGLKGDAIPLAARIFAIVDFWDAVISNRPYRPGWPKEKVISNIMAGSGSHFDPVVVEAFLKLLKNDGAISPSENLHHSTLHS